MGGMIG